MKKNQNEERWSPGIFDWRLFALLPGVKFLIHLLASNKYGYFRDELYFLDCARHLDWGYVDHAPLVAIYAKVGLLLGGSLPALRILSAIAGAVLVLLTMLIARQLGGDRFAQALAGLCVIAAPIYLGVYSILSMNAFEPLFWMGCIYIFILIVRTDRSPLWILFGVLAGLGLENKHSTLLFGLAFVIALLLTPQRRELLKPWIWMGGFIALLIFLPNLIWQIQHGFPTIEDLENVRQTGKNVALNPLQFIGQQVLILYPLLFPVWFTGLVSLLAGKGKRMRSLGWTYLVLLILMILLKAKNYYLAPIYPMLFAAGGVAIENWLGHRAFSLNRLWPRATLLTIVLVIAAAMIPAWVPLLPPDKMVAYQRFLKMVPPKTEVHHSGPLMQLYGDQFGWKELVAEVARIYWSLPPEEREQTAIFASNYGEAGAINLFGPSYNLPQAICAHQTHYFWGPRGFEGDTIIWLQWERRHLEELCRSVEKAGEHYHRWGMAEENRPIYICRGLHTPLTQLWPRLKHWN